MGWFPEKGEEIKTGRNNEMGIVVGINSGIKVLKQHVVPEI